MTNLDLINSGGLGDPFLTPSTLAMNLWPGWIPGKHLLYMGARIASGLLRGNARIIISCPPRIGKSVLGSKTTIPWFLEKFPGQDVMLASYNSDEASRHGQVARDIIKERSDLFSVRVGDKVQRTDKFKMDNGAEVFFLGLNGGATGKGANLLLIDDYIKGIEEALSPTHLEKLWMGYMANFDTRLAPNASIIVIATRWAKNDLIGHLLTDLSDDNWDYIEIPAQCVDENDILGREMGEFIAPERFDASYYERRKKLYTGTYLWESLYQQRPIDDLTEFTSADWLQVDDWPIGIRLQKVRSWDMAATQGGGDWTVGSLLARHLDDTGRCAILDIRRKQLGPKGVEDLIRATAIADGVDVVIQLEQEPGSQGKALVDHYKRNVLRGFKVVTSPVGNKSKVVRAQPMIAAVESGRLYCVASGGSWIDSFKNEFGTFPSEGTGFHDDMVDSVSHSYNYLYQEVRLSPAWFSIDDYAGSYFDDNGNDGNDLITGCVW